MTDLPALLRRIQGATGPDEALGRDLAALFIDREDYPAVGVLCVQAVRGSVDAALALSEHFLPGRDLSFGRRITEGFCYCSIGGDDAPGAMGETLPLAILAALLLAQSTPAP